MKTSQVLLSATALILSLSQIACTAKIEGKSDGGGGDENPAPAGYNFSQMDGTWKTGCVAESGGIYSETVLILSGGSFDSTSKVYRTSPCVDANLWDTQSQKGRFVYAGDSSTEPGSVLVRIEMPQPGTNVTQIEHDLALLKDGKLYLGDRSGSYTGDYPSHVDTQKPFTK